MFSITVVIAEVLRFIIRVTRPVSDVIFSMIYRLIMGETKQLPPIEDEILLMSASVLASKIRNKQIKCEKVMQAYINRAQMVQPFINAIAGARYEEALKEAQDVDKFLEETKLFPEEIEQKTPLLGIPFSTKENLGVKGLPQTFGLVRCRNNKAERDASAAALYKKAGAISLCVTNISELSLWWESWNNVFGILKNPYDNTRTSGGSSGGEASLITSAGSIIGVGTDLGGSVRIPCSFCGIYGHKPTAGVISNKGGLYDEKECDIREPVASTGPMCRFVEDLPLLFKILSDNDNRIQYNTKIDFRNVKIYYMEEMPGYLLSAIPEIKKAVKKAVDYFEREYNNKAIELKLEEFKYGFEITRVRTFECSVRSIKSNLTKDCKEINFHWELLKSLFGWSEFTLPIIYFAINELYSRDSHYYKIKNIFDKLTQKLEAALRGNSILLLPTHPEIAPHHLTTIPKFPNICYTSVFNGVGFPATQIPAGMHKGLPFGIQAVSGKFQDHLTIATAVELDRLFRGWRSPCQINV